MSKRFFYDLFDRHRFDRDPTQGGICLRLGRTKHGKRRGSLRIFIRAAGRRTRSGLREIFHGKLLFLRHLIFQFQNNTLYPIRIETKTEGGTATVSLIGTETRNYRTELEYEDVAKTEYDVTYQTMQANNPEGYRDGDYIVEPCHGYKIKTYR